MDAPGPSLGPLRERVRRAPVARLATLRPDGSPHLVPITFAVDGRRVVSAVDHKPKATTDLQRLRNIAARSDVAVLVDHYEDDWTRLWWARADATAEIVEPGTAEHAQVVGLLAAKYEVYERRPPAGPAIVMTVDRWSTWQASPDPAP